MPIYPESEIKKGITGVIELKIYIDEKGNVMEAIVIRNTTNSKILEENSIKAALRCKYYPAYYNYKPVAVWTTKSYTFHDK
jgi:TonB family protein